ncbi:hypothetical protein JQC92_15225 [Shewanella sp. 202IG2-18]|uniref:hypothetical protein n=1 Tax=Parashewanella hymeniacidonis TaxID=2807618 RepID=UPI00195FE1CE|nr:hypothetical protein [Parashewanella hymeniacidonis]MBM7073365.1 hypothetical protein [Parashewanella hymeniacidonis]
MCLRSLAVNLPLSLYLIFSGVTLAAPVVQNFTRSNASNYAQDPKPHIFPSGQTNCKALNFTGKGDTCMPIFNTSNQTIYFWIEKDIWVPKNDPLGIEPHYAIGY